MPANYAHYRFGAEMLKLMPGDIRRKVNRFRRLYDVGLHGPDVFFYSNPLHGTKVSDMGRRLHGQSGADFFMRACRGLRMEPSEAGETYLYGLLSHYCLDSGCRPFAEEKAREDDCTLGGIEAEFDRFLLEKDGKVPPCEQDLSRHMRLTPEEYKIAAGFYSGVNPAQMQAVVKNMERTTKIAAVPAGVRRKTVEAAFGLLSKDRKGLFIPAQEDLLCGKWNEELLLLYEQAQERFLTLLMQISAHMTYNAPLGEEFMAKFG